MIIFEVVMPSLKGSFIHLKAPRIRQELKAPQVNEDLKAPDSMDSRLQFELDPHITKEILTKQFMNDDSRN